MAAAALSAAPPVPAARPDPPDRLTRVHGGIVRGDLAARRLALVFTGHEHAEGGNAILDSLARAGLRGSFFLTGDFLRNPSFAPLIRRMVSGGHYVGPHSDRHLLCCDWDERRRTLVSANAFRQDVLENLRELERFGVSRDAVRSWVPAYEWYNDETVSWGAALGLQTVSFTPGTRANADYTGEADRNFVSSDEIVASIQARERSDPAGLNGFVLLMHLGAGPARADKFHRRLDEVIEFLLSRQYEPVRVDELLDDRRAPRRPAPEE
jgi:peptidoglycan/xylan/chitin deacetylase (PgdA/CDA1 family)